MLLPSLECLRLGPGPNAGCIVWQPNKICQPAPVTAVAVGGCTLQVIECWTAAEWDRPRTQVTLGVMSLGSEPRFTPGFLDAALAAIREHDVQFLTGWFGDTAGQIGDLCQAAVAAGRPAVCPPWRVAARGTTQSPLPEMQWLQSQRASEAWGQSAQVLDCYAAFPTYICCLGPCFKDEDPKWRASDGLESAPGWDAEARLSAAFKQHLVPLSRVPVWLQAPPAAWPAKPIFGYLKQKPPALDKWYDDIHQVLLWVGHANMSQKKREARREGVLAADRRRSAATCG